LKKEHKYTCEGAISGQNTTLLFSIIGEMKVRIDTVLGWRWEGN
jgi:hypothetical protein